jgi:hypothetical protein
MVMSNEIQIKGAKIQDAFHYACLAAGWDSAIDLESHPRGVNTRTKALKMAVRCAKEAGLTAYASRLASAPALVWSIKAQAKALGIDANSGCVIYCSVECGRPAVGGYDGLCSECWHEATIDGAL